MANNDLGNQLGMLQQMKGLLEEIPALFEKMGGSIGKQTSALNQLATASKEANDPKKIKDMNSALEELAEGTDKASKGFSKQQKAMAGVGAAAVGAKAGFGAFKNILGGTMNAVTGLASSMFNLATGAFGAVMGMWSGLIGMAQGGGGGGGLREALEKVREEFGNIATNEGKAVVDTFKEIRGSGNFAAKSGLSLRRVFGGIKEQLAGVLELAKEFGPAFSRMAEDFKSNAVELIILNKGLGLSATSLSNLGDMARQSGQTMNEVLNETAQTSVHLGKAFGISSKLIGKNMNELTEDIGTFGHMSVKELGATAAYAAKLGIEIKSLKGMFDKFANFEDAAMGAAKLAETFGMNVDAMELMNAESPAEQMDMMRKAFLETGKSLDDLSRQEKAYLAEQMGVEAKDLYAAFDPANADLTFDDMMAEAELAQEKVSPEEAMLEVAKNIEKQFSSGMKQMKGFFDAFMQGLEMGIRKTEFFRAVMREIRKALKTVYRIGRKTADALFGKDGVFGAQQDKFLPKIKKYLGEIVKFFEKLSGAIIKLGEGISGQSDYSVVDFVTEMWEAAKAFFQSDAVQDMGKSIIDGLSNAIQYVMTEAPKLLDKLTQVITDFIAGDSGPFSGFEFLGSPDSPINSALSDAFENIKKLWPTLKKSIGDLLSSLVDLALDWAGNNKMLLVKVAAVLFGPAAIGAVITGLLSGLMTYATTILIPGLFAAGGFFGTGGTFMLAFEAAALAGGSGLAAGLGAIGTALAPVLIWVAAIIGIIMVLYEAVQSLADMFAIFGDDTVSIGEKVGAAIYSPFQVIEAITKAVANLLDFITFGFFDFSGKADTLFADIRDGFMRVFGLLTPLFEKLIVIGMVMFEKLKFGVSLVVEAFSVMSDVIKRVFEIAMAVIGPMVEILAIVVYGTIMKVVDGWIMIGKAAMSAFNEYIMPFIQPVIDALSPVIDAVKNISSSFLDMAMTVADVLNPVKWIQMAIDIGKGFLENFDIADMIKEKMAGAVDAVKGFFGISSPSKVFADIGGDLVAGMEVGTADMDKTLKGPSQKSIDGLAKDVGALDTSKLEDASSKLDGINSMTGAVKELSDSLKDITVGGGGKKLKAISKELGVILPEVVNVGTTIENFATNFGEQNLVMLQKKTTALVEVILPLTTSIKTLTDSLNSMLESLFKLSEGSKKKSPKALGENLMSALGEIFGVEGSGGLLGNVNDFFTSFPPTMLDKLNGSLKKYAGIVNGISTSATEISTALTSMVEVWGKVPAVTKAAGQAAANVEALVNQLNAVNQGFSGIDGEAVVTVKAVGEALMGDNTLTVKHESLNIHMAVKVNIDSKDLAGALSDGPNGPYFVINTGQNGGAGAGETP
jgi:hypothetical protein